MNLRHRTLDGCLVPRPLEQPAPLPYAMHVLLIAEACHGRRGNSRETVRGGRRCGTSQGNHWGAGRSVRADAAGPQRSECGRARGQRRAWIDDAVAVRPARKRPRVAGPGPGRLSDTWPLRLSGEPRVSIGVAEGNTPVLDFTGHYGEARMSIEVDEEGLPSFVLMDGDGNDRVSIRIDRRGTPHLEFFDADGRPVRE